MKRPMTHTGLAVVIATGVVGGALIELLLLRVFFALSFAWYQWGAFGVLWLRFADAVAWGLSFFIAGVIVGVLLRKLIGQRSIVWSPVVAGAAMIVLVAAPLYRVWDMEQLADGSWQSSVSGAYARYGAHFASASLGGMLGALVHRRRPRSAATDR